MNLFTKLQRFKKTNKAIRQSSRGGNIRPLNKYSYRRNHTIDGETYSDMEGFFNVKDTNNSESHRVKIHHLRKVRRRLGVSLIVVMIVIFLLGFVIWQSIIGVKIVGVSSGASMPLDSSAYSSKIQDYLNKNPLQRSWLTLDIVKLTRYLQDNGMSEVLNLEVDTSNHQIGKVAIILSLRKPVVSWSEDGRQLLYVDNEGVSFKKNYFTEPVVKIIDESGVKSINNKVLTSNRFLSFVGLVAGNLNRLGYNVKSIVLPPGTSHQILVYINNVAYPVKFSIDRGAAVQVEDATRAIKYLELKEIQPNYIDVRVSGRVYY